MSYIYIYGPDVERDYHSLLYEEILLPALQRINPALPPQAVQAALYKLKNFESGTLLQKNMISQTTCKTACPVNFAHGGE